MELVLTVPSKCQEDGKKKGQITLNIPRTQGLKEGTLVYRRKNIELSDHIGKNILNKVIKYPVSGDITLKVGEPLMLQLFCREEYAFVEGPVVELSKKRPVTKEDILRQMHKTGTVPFELENFEVNMDERLFPSYVCIKNCAAKRLFFVRRKIEEYEEKKRIRK